VVITFLHLADGVLSALVVATVDLLDVPPKPPKASPFANETAVLTGNPPYSIAPYS
jgi:hypothetical protein